MTQADILRDLNTLLDRYVERRNVLDKMSMETHIRDDLGVSSLHQIDMLLEIEEHFGITIPDSEAASAETIGGWVTLIARRLEQKPTEPLEAKAEESQPLLDPGQELKEGANS